MIVEGGSHDQCVNDMLEFDWKNFEKLSKSWHDGQKVGRDSNRYSRIGNQEPLEVILATLLIVSIQVSTLLAMYSLYAQCLQIVKMVYVADPVAYSMSIRLLSLQ
jgi:hypothetical protein